MIRAAWASNPSRPSSKVVGWNADFDSSMTTYYVADNSEAKQSTISWPNPQSVRAPTATSCGRLTKLAQPDVVAGGGELKPFVGSPGADTSEWQLRVAARGFLLWLAADIVSPAKDP